MIRIPNINSLADLIDRLIVELLKLSFFENSKRQEHSKKNPDYKLIAEYDNKSRDCCELRSLIKNEINRLMEEIILSGDYRTIKEPRTFTPTQKTIPDILEEMCKERARSLYNGELAKTFEHELSRILQ